MTAQEFSTQFDLSYNNLMTDKAPEVNEYEKSYLLTMAQEQLVKQLYQNFEVAELMRRGCDTLVTKADLTPVEGAAVTPLTRAGFHQGVFTLPDDLWYVIHESVLVKGDDPCYEGRHIKVRPERYDELDRDLGNPFRSPDASRALRIDAGSLEGGRTVEVVSAKEIGGYSVQYIRRPKPILLVDLDDGEWAGYGLRLRGRTAFDPDKPCELGESVHNEIVTMAAQMAQAAYKGGVTTIN